MRKAMAILFTAAAMMGYSTFQGDTVTSTHVVHTGDTLWSISSGYAKTEDIRGLYSRIIADNHLDRNGTLKPGTTLVIRHEP